ncbi:hypothetical protein IJ579_00265 [bacterium]|nr:hypothetical protein [bacterium]
MTIEFQLTNKSGNVTPQWAKQPADNKISTPSELEKPADSHKVRNWSIGLGAAATLISLGVLGRGGHLGEGVQKFLRGTAKDVHLKPNVHLEEDVLTGAGSRVEEAAVTVEEHIGSAAKVEEAAVTVEEHIGSAAKVEEVAVTVEEHIGSAAKVEETVVAAEEHIAGETVGRAEQTTTQAPAVSVKPAKPTITAEEAAKINAELDRTIPVLDERVPLSVPVRFWDDFINQTEKVVDDIDYVTGSNKHFYQRMYHLKDGTIAEVETYKFVGKENETKEIISEIKHGNLTYYYGDDGTIRYISGEVGGVTGWQHYDADGLLTYTSNRAGKRVNYDKGTNIPVYMEYYRTDGSYDIIKEDIINDGKIVHERFRKGRTYVDYPAID